MPVEVLLVLGLGLGQSAVYSVLSLWKSLTNPEPLASQRTNLNGTFAQDRPWLDLAYQLAGLVFPAVCALLALYLLRLWHDGGATIGWDRTRPRFDALWAVLLAAAIGVPGLGLYLAAHALGVTTSVQPANLVQQWWSVPVYLGMAFMNGFLEEIVMVGYLLTRLRDREWAWWAAIVASALIRGTYHLYQGFGGFVGNLAMGLLLGVFYARTRRVAPAVWAHALIDAVVFLGYPLVAGLLPGLR